MKKNRLLELAGIVTEMDDVEDAEDKLMVELQPLKDDLDAIMKKYPHASYDDVCDWLKS